MVIAVAGLYLDTRSMREKENAKPALLFLYCVPVDCRVEQNTEVGRYLVLWIGTSRIATICRARRIFFGHRMGTIGFHIFVAATLLPAKCHFESPIERQWVSTKQRSINVHENGSQKSPLDCHF